ncbi:MAG: glycosyltransferase family A protein [Patescibacteria group bacterium]
MHHLGLDIYTHKDLTSARLFFEKVFAEHVPQLPRKLPSCQISIVIPVFGERIDRLKMQIESFERQTLSRKFFEVIYIVNNDISDGTKEWRDVYDKNQKAISFLKKYKGISLFVIDRSSKGKEIKNCNVGSARNRALAEVCARYFLQKEDGILFQTDADVRLDNKRHLQKILSAFRNDSRIFGASGGVIYEIDPDTEDAAVRKEYIKYFDCIRYSFQWNTLLRELHVKDLPLPAFPTRFSGMHMITRVITSAVIGGVLERGFAEDTLFGKAIEKYAEKKGGYILPKREEWYVISALRESFRTEASYGTALTKIIQNKAAFVISEKAPYFPYFMNKMLSDLRKMKSLDEAFLFLYPKNTSLHLLTKKDVKDLLRDLGEARGNNERYIAYKKWRIKHRGTKRGPLEEMYFQDYPLIKLTKYRLDKLKKLLHVDPKKRLHFENVTKNFHHFRKPKL